MEKPQREVHKQSLIIKIFDSDNRRATVLTPLISLGEIIPWFPAVYNHGLQGARRHNKRIVIVVPRLFECLVERFPCSWRIVIKREHHLSMIWHRHKRLGEKGGRWPKPVHWEEKSQILIDELKPLISSIAWGTVVGVFTTDVHTYSPAFPTDYNHWTVGRFQRVNPHGPQNSIVFVPSKEVMESYHYDWQQHNKPFVAIRAHSGIIDTQKRWRYWNDFLEIMENEFEGTVFRIGGLDDLNIELKPRENFVDLGHTHDTVAPLLYQMSHMDYCISPVGGISWIALAQKVPSILYADDGSRRFYSNPGIGYDGLDMLRGWGTGRIDFLTGGLFDNLTAEEVFERFRKFRQD